MVLEAHEDHSTPTHCAVAGANSKAVLMSKFMRFRFQPVTRQKQESRKCNQHQLGQPNGGRQSFSAFSRSAIASTILPGWHTPAQ